MSQHYNIQINIQKVTVVPATDPARGMQQVISGKDREVTSILELKVTAETEVEAYEKAYRMLVANNPDVVVVPAGVTVGQDSYVEWRPVRDNPQA